jgi:hypothetical protein
MRRLLIDFFGRSGLTAPSVKNSKIQRVLYGLTGGRAALRASSVLPAVALCVILCGCPIEDLSPVLAAVEYVDDWNIKVIIVIINGSVPCDVRDETISVYSTKHNLYYRITGTKNYQKLNIYAFCAGSLNRTTRCG